jgi:alpha-tubulin suppressor-like RCC1 family protein
LILNLLVYLKNNILNFLKYILECGKLFSVGYNGFGCICDGSTNNCSIIKQINYFKNIFIVDIVCGCRHCLSISNKGEIYSWGDNFYGQIGNGKDANRKLQLTPIKIFKI